MYKHDNDDIVFIVVFIVKAFFKEFWPAVVVWTTVFLCAVAICTSCIQREPYLLRHISKTKMSELEHSGATPAMDGFVYGFIGSHEETVDRLTREGADCYRYFNVLHVQPEAWIWAPFSPWFAGLTEWMEDSDAFLVNAQQDTARFAYYGGRDYIIDWSRLDEAEVDSLTALTLVCARGQRIFLDQFWLDLHPWMLFGGEGARFTVFPQEWHRNIRRYLYALRAETEVVVNGEWNSPQELLDGRKTYLPPLYLENCQQRPDGTPWIRAIETYRSHRGNILSVRAESQPWVDQAISEWLYVGGRLAFTGTEAQMDSAYTWAMDRRKGAAPKPLPAEGGRVLWFGAN